jgi:hypothetical protein
MAVSIHEHCLHVKYFSVVVAAYSPQVVDDLSTDGVALVGILGLMLVIVYSAPRLLRRR